MDISSLVRDAAKVRASLVVREGKLITLRGCKIHTPKRYTERKLAYVSTEVKVVAIFAIIVDDTHYAVSKAITMMPLSPTAITTFVHGDEEYFQFEFDPGAVVCPNINLIKDKNINYSVYDEIIAKGHVPWSFTYEDLGKLFFNTPRYSGGVLSPTNVALEMIAASISRNAKDLTKFYRHQIQTMADQTRIPPHFIAFRNIIYGANNTTAKLLGSYFDDNMLSALVNPSERAEGVETLLRI